MAGTYACAYHASMRRIIAASILLVSGMSVQAQEPFAEKVQHAPGRSPDRIVLTWRKDPTRTQSVTWRTDTSVTSAIAEYAEAKAGPEFAGDAKKRAVAVSSSFKSDLSDAHFHSAHFENLTPDTQYAYRVGDGVHWSEWHHFTTASATPAKFRFLYFGDAQYQLKERWAPLVHAAHLAAPDSRFSVHAGDLVNIGGRDAEWGEWFQAAEPLNRTMPVIPTPGNHEYLHDEGHKLPPYWTKQFALPDNGPKGLAAGVFHVDFQGLRIISLNSNEQKPEQVDWLKRVLEKNPNRWTIVTFHHPIYSLASGRDNSSLRALWQPIFDKHRVDLALQGHDHCYGRSGLRGYEGAPGGTVYVVSVSGPMFNSPNQDATWTVRKGTGVQLFQAITIDGDSLHFEARTLAGELFDSFTLRKQDGQANVLTNGPHDPRSVLPPAPRTGPATTEKSFPWVPWAMLLLLVLVGVLVALRLLRRRGPD